MLSTLVCVCRWHAIVLVGAYFSVSRRSGTAPVLGDITSRICARTAGLSTHSQAARCKTPQSIEMRLLPAGAPRLGLRAAFGKSRAPRFRCRGDDVGALPPRPHQNYGDFLSGRLMDSRTAAPMHKVLSKIDARMVQAAWAMWTHSVSWSRGVDRLMRDYDQVVRARAL